MAKNGDKVVVKVVRHPGRIRPAYTYPENVEKAAEQIQLELTRRPSPSAQDFRDVLTFTIDPKDAKDFDDALSIRRAEGGLWEVGVHIADVSHYVKEGSIIDKEAYRRATSVYLVDRTIPMLPERLCNNLCSLRPDEEKMTYSVIFLIDEQGEVKKKSHIAHTVIRSNRRFTYEEVQEILETGQGEYVTELQTLNTMAKALRAKRMAAGAINFDRIEVKFEIEEATGRPLSIYFKEQKDAHKLIEEFMLLANRTVAERIGKPKAGTKPQGVPLTASTTCPTPTSWRT